MALRITKASISLAFELSLSVCTYAYLLRITVHRFHLLTLWLFPG